ncbi:hypothetical protein STEG23_019084 [Scotinomys teguina]
MMTEAREFQSKFQHQTFDLVYTFSEGNHHTPATSVLIVYSLQYPKFKTLKSTPLPYPSQVLVTPLFSPPPLPPSSPFPLFLLDIGSKALDSFRFDIIPYV